MNVNPDPSKQVQKLLFSKKQFPNHIHLYILMITTFRKFNSKNTYIIPRSVLLKISSPSLDTVLIMEALFMIMH